MTDFGTSTNFTESVNICLMALGEQATTSVGSLTGQVGQQTVVNLAVRTLDEVNKDVEARGWWFQSPRGDIIGISSGTPTWNASHPEEFRRYVTIRAARILQTRYITDETLHKLTLEEEIYSKAVLEAKDAEQDSNVTFALPQEIEDLGIRGVMFLQSNLEEKLGTLKLGTELAQTELLKAQELKTDAEKALIDAQELLIDQQKLTEVQETAKRTAETALIADQEVLVTQQALTEAQQTAKVTAETALIADQEVLVTQQALTEAQETAKREAEKDLVIAQDAKTDAETALIADQEALVTQQTLTEVENTTKTQREAELLATQASGVSADIQLKQQQSNLTSAQTLKTDAEKLLVDEQTAKTTAEADLIADQEALVTQQTLTEVQETAKREAEKDLLLAQELKVDEETAKVTAEKDLLVAQELKVDEETAKVTAEAALIADQEALVTQQLQTEINETSKRLSEKELIDAQAAGVSADIDLKQQQSNLTASQELKVDAETATEGSRKLDIEADTTLKGKQGALIDAQELKTDAETTLITAQELKTDAETTLTTKQGALVDAQSAEISSNIDLKQQQSNLTASQELKTDAEKLLVDAQTSLTADQEAKTVAEKEILESQKTKLDAETAYMITAEKNWFDTGGVDISGTVRSYKDFRPEMRIMGIQEAAFQSLPAYKKVELIKDAVQLRTDRASPATATNIVASVNKILRYLGVNKVSSNTNEHALASEAKELLEDTDLELQARGWWFNTEIDVEVSASVTNVIPWDSDWLNIEINNIPTTKQKHGTDELVRNLETKSYNDWAGTHKATIIYKRDLDETPQKYREYLEVKVAAILAELYPQSGSEIQRIRKLEAELETYFKDRENDQGNYNIFDNYDTNERIGFNRNYDLN